MTYNIEGNLQYAADVGIILPTYCEAQNIERLVTEIEDLPLNACILVIDDSSSDGTANIIRALQPKYLNLFLLVRPQKSGLGSAITDGFRAFLSMPNVPHYVVTMDADYSHNPQDLPRIVNSITGYDVVIGSRYIADGKTDGWPLSRKIISRGANTLARSLLGLKLRDCTSGYRCYSTNFLTQIISYLHSQTYDIQIETVKQAHNQHFKIHEVPILFVNRKKSKSKLSLLEIENYVSYIFKTIVHNKNP
jgi:dolichol-phosphate mannosyltransferase